MDAAAWDASTAPAAPAASADAALSGTSNTNNAHVLYFLWINKFACVQQSRQRGRQRGSRQLAAGKRCRLQGSREREWEKGAPAEIKALLIIFNRLYTYT